MAHEEATGMRLARESEGRTAMMAEPAASGTCSTCGGGAAAATSSFVYALGRVEPRFPSLSVEKEFAQAVGRAQTAKLADRQAIHTVLTQPENAYLIRQLCWVFTIEGIDCYVVVPPGSEEARYLVEALRPSPREGDIDVVIGSIGPPVGGRACNGLMLPSVALTQIYSFNIDELVAKLPRPKEVGEAAFKAVVQTLLQLTENPGVRPDHRAINYLVTRDPALHAAVAQRAQHKESLAGVEVRLSALSTSRQIKEVVLTFRQRETDAAERLFARVDTTELFPFLVSKLAPYTER
jgi:PatG Domain